ncbi:MAG: hypothetical protein MPJ78_19865 [Hyphomicrobiaceae bacterium]|nr:hypothetical protein [Hyphomicrobiaceae bacterium]
MKTDAPATNSPANGTTPGQPTNSEAPAEPAAPGHVEACLARAAETIYARDKALPVVVRASPEWRAWRQWRKDHGLPTALMERAERFTVPLAWPPADLGALEAACTDAQTSLAVLLKGGGPESPSEGGGRRG